MSIIIYLYICVCWLRAFFLWRFRQHGGIQTTRGATLIGGSWQQGRCQGHPPPPACAMRQTTSCSRELVEGGVNKDAKLTKSFRRESVVGLGVVPSECDDIFNIQID